MLGFFSFIKAIKMAYRKFFLHDGEVILKNALFSVHLVKLETHESFLEEGPKDP